MRPRASEPSRLFRVPRSAFRLLMPHTTFQVGRLTCHALEAGRQALDGGAMFGVVPKPLWQRRIPADERNGIPLALRGFLVEHDDGLVLVDTGLGNKEDEKFKDIYGVVNEGKDGRSQLEYALAELGHTPADVRWVIDTHLHFDHAGGNTYREPSGRVTLTSPKARYVVQRRELEFARHTNERTAASYLPPNFESAPFTLIDGDAQPPPGIRCLPTPGHVPYHQTVLVESGGERVCFLADLVQTSAHLPLPSIMGSDLQPLVTLESRRGEGKWGRGKRIPGQPESAFSFSWRRTAPGDRKPEQQNAAHPSQPADPDQSDPRDRPRRSATGRADRGGSVGRGARARPRPGRGGAARATPGREDHGLREVQVRGGEGGAGGEEKAARHPPQGSEVPAGDRRSCLRLQDPPRAGVPAGRQQGQGDHDVPGSADGPHRPGTCGARPRRQRAEGHRQDRAGPEARGSEHVDGACTKVKTSSVIRVP